MVAPNHPSQAEMDEIASIFAYDPNSGIISRKLPQRWKSKAFEQHFRRDGYARVSVRQKFYQAHRIAWFLYHGTWPTLSIDHINGCRSDNRISNLRQATSSENGRNRMGSVVKLKGVSFIGRLEQWQAQITMHGKCYYLGLFNSEQEAHAAYVQASIMHGDFANTGANP